FADEHILRAIAEANGAAPYGLHLIDQRLADVLGENSCDDVERRVIGVPSPLDKSRFDARLLHGAADGLAAAVNQNRPHADRLHEHDVSQTGSYGSRVLQGASAQL